MIPSDTSGTEKTMTTVAQCISAILPYVQSVQAIQLGAQPVDVGDIHASWDPLGKVPDLESALQAAQQHCSAFTGNGLNPLSSFPTALSTATGSVASGTGIVNDLETIITVLGQLPSGGSPTASQQQSVNNALSDIVNQVNGLQSSLSSIQTTATTFQGDMATDIETLTNGSQSVAAALARIDQDFEDAEEIFEYLPSPLKEDADDILTTIKNQMVGYLTAVQTAITNAISNEKAVVVALGGLEDLFAGLADDYSTLAQQVTNVSDQNFGSILQQIDASVLQSYWQDTSSFATANGFGVSSSS